MSGHILLTQQKGVLLASSRQVRDSAMDHTRLRMVSIANDKKEEEEKNLSQILNSAEVEKSYPIEKFKVHKS